MTPDIHFYIVDCIRKVVHLALFSLLKRDILVNAFLLSSSDYYFF